MVQPYVYHYNDLRPAGTTAGVLTAASAAALTVTGETLGRLFVSALRRRINLPVKSDENFPVLLTGAVRIRP